ncbi:hypothetical protein SDC9_32541 [bioreactor metagenome]|uniref:Uncharacterized protein n=1 Tax=bioreactor metagenome TaxID=1076179 RepID=A0A644V5F9_9ZZZZ
MKINKEVINVLILAILFILIVVAGGVFGFIDFLSYCHKERKALKKIDEKYPV